ncbi:MAG: response regulator transcription factor [Oscillospiraceae bacterium]|nr:response regulator transcription factor [Oscillospiraceae bacterium]
MERILIVDDDKITCEMLSFNLQRDGYETLISQSGTEAVRICREESSPDLMVLDLMIPGMNGLDICKEVRKFSTIPIIMLTTKDDTFEKVLGLELGADDYITKPFDMKEISARIKALLRRTKSFNAMENDKQDKKIIMYDNLVIDMNRFELKIGGTVLEIPPKELELLFYLASNPNKVFTRDQLLDDVWGFEYYGDSRTIDVHVKRLRSKLDGSSRKWFLKTVWGVGYKFELNE